jgi:preprotein translocase subunit SecE
LWTLCYDESVDLRVIFRLRKMVNPIQFARETAAELKKVVWPDRKTGIQHTVLVIVFTIVSAAALAAIDFGFAKIIQWLITFKK